MKDYAHVGQWYSGGLENRFPPGFPRSIRGVGVSSRIEALAE